MEYPMRLVERVQLERRHRGLSIRAAASKLSLISNTTWDKFERTGVASPKVREAIARTFDWPMDWPEELPAVPVRPEQVNQLDEIGQQIEELTALVRWLIAREVEQGADEPLPLPGTRAER
jgi:hypothetical protein